MRLFLTEVWDPASPKADQDKVARSAGCRNPGSENGHLVVMKKCPPEFEVDAVALYESRPGVMIRAA
ncbi:hypothetical protein ABZW32_14285 [Streptomyces sp. NPDC004667]|uniref:hypothetical protein n=1 Tax=Streptomyces sp. NPDC004667 TaxID=3154285 RepID=UPI0033BD27DF